MPNRHGQDEDYRYGFQGQEQDNEIKGKGNSVNYKYRMHDPRIGRFFATDPLEAKYPYYSSYQFSGNQVIFTIELEGAEPLKDANAYGKKLATQGPSTKIGYIYKVPGERTSSGKPYVGRTEQGSPEARGKNAKDGRVRLNKDAQSVYNADINGNGAHQEQKALNASGGKANTDNKINAQSKKKYDAMKAKLKSPSAGGVTPKIIKGGGTVVVILDASAVATGSPNNPLETFRKPGTGEQNRAYASPVTEENAPPYYEWSMVPNTTDRQIRYYNDYEKRDGVWRGKGDPIRTDTFNKDGNKVIPRQSI